MRSVVIQQDVCHWQCDTLEWRGHAYDTAETVWLFDVILESRDSIAQLYVMWCAAADDEDDDDYSYHGNEDAAGSSTAAPSRDYDDNNKSTPSHFPRPGN